MQELRHSLRALLKAPGYTAVVILTLGLAIGANSVIFSFANILLIKPLPIADPATLAWLFTLDPQRTTMRGRWSYADFDDVRRAARSFVTLSASTTENVTLTGRAEPRRLQAQKVSATLFETWGVQPVLGRLLRPEEDVAGAPCAVVLSHKLWRTYFQSDPTIVSQPIGIDGRPCTVAGVLTPSIEFGNLADEDVWMPIARNPGETRRDERRYSVEGRLRPGVTHEEAESELKTIMARLASEHPETNRNWTARVAQTREAIAGGDTWVILALLGLVVCLVLLIACANLANLALARTSSRRRELAVRAALGATRWRVVRQLVTESVMLGVAGGAAGLAIADAGLRIIRSVAFEPIFELIVVDRNVLIFGAALSILSPILFTLLPAIHATDESLDESLKESARNMGGVRARRSRHALVVAQVGLALTLLVVATLVVRSMIALNRIDLGFDPRPLLAAKIEVPSWKHREDQDVVRVHDDVLARLRRLPGVADAAATSALPVLSAGSRTAFDIAGRTNGPGDRPWAIRVAVSDAFFRAVGIPVRTGRDFQPSDRIDAEPVAIVSAETARRYWGSTGQALGGRISVPEGSTADRLVWRRIVGVVGDAANPDLGSAPDPQVYLPLAQRPARGVALVVNSARTGDLPAALREAVRETDADMPLFQLRPMEEAVYIENATSRVLGGMFAAFAVLALVLASTGLYAVIAYSVRQRTQEIGVRIALGAAPRDIPRLILAQGLRLVGIGGVIGLGGAVAVSRAVRQIFYGVTPLDPATYGGVIAVVLLSAGLAMWVPARRAARLDPVRSLRGE